MIRSWPDRRSTSWANSRRIRRRTTHSWRRRVRLGWYTPTSGTSLIICRSCSARRTASSISWGPSQLRESHQRLALRTPGAGAVEQRGQHAARGLRVHEDEDGGEGYPRGGCSACVGAVREYVGRYGQPAVYEPHVAPPEGARVVRAVVLGDVLALAAVDDAGR